MPRVVGVAERSYDTRVFFDKIKNLDMHLDEIDGELHILDEASNMRHLLVLYKFRFPYSSVGSGRLIELWKGVSYKFPVCSRSSQKGSS